MYTREDVLGFINNVIVDNFGDISEEDTRIDETGIDSFAIAVLYLELDEKYGCFDSTYSEEMKNEINVSTLGELIDVVMEFQSKG